ncbi:cyclin domain-containing protein [Xylaria bambusicola]|uniref:cyclin domain-containing protein n=1 Tax=Xylaria bambusicola TaxID=326684 RepID=UPI002007BF23|nr:cyclin domain-containing protein [Xylaria bambusicola]KAI0518519.1 cyclin domain-containing protein [Xylaria bambusicola]
MAANYWESTQRRHWQFSKDELAEMREKLEESEQSLVQMFPLPQRRHLNIYFNQQLGRLGKRLGVRQQALATAQTYLKRFYCTVEIRRTNPYLVIATALYLACKMEECPQHIRLVVSEARSLWPVDSLTLDISRLGECEFFMISEMHSQLIVHQPYRTLTNLQSDLFLSQDESNLALSIINDHYMTDLPLLYPPHIIALTAILLALVLRPNSPGGTATSMAAATAALAQVQAQASSRASGSNANQNASGVSEKERQQEARLNKVQRYAGFLTESNVDIEGMADCTQELISFYECHEQYNDKITREQINRFVKARGLDKP